MPMSLIMSENVEHSSEKTPRELIIIIIKIIIIIAEVEIEQ